MTERNADVSKTLTEKWKKGELPDGWYYKTSILGNITIADSSTLHKYRNKKDWEDIITILAPVPSFEEWEQLKNWADFTNDYHGLREKLEIAEYENAQLKKWCEEFNALDVAKENEKLKSKLQLKETAYDFDTARLEEENTKLKELLKECRSPINYALCLNLSEEEKKEFKNLLLKIKQVLGED